MSVALAALTIVILPVVSADASTCKIGAAGDIAGPGFEAGAMRSAELIIREDPGKVLALGDLAYSDGTPEEFASYYRPTWGKFEDKTEAIAGNHEYRTPGGDGMEAELGDLSNDNRSITQCGWRIVLVNQYKGVPAGAEYIAAERAAHPEAPLLVAWHEPRFSSGSAHGDEPAVQPLWAAAVRAEAKIVLNAHEHNYERFAPMDEQGQAAPAGTRIFVSGLGGYKPKVMGTTKANSQRRITGEADSASVLFLTLSSKGSYSWTTKRWDGAVQDEGSAD